MMVRDTFSIEGRGYVAVIDDVVPGLGIGSHLRQGDLSWTIVGIEAVNSLPDVSSMGYLLRPDAIRRYPGRPDGYAPRPSIGEVFP